MSCEDALEAIAAAPVGVLGLTAKDGTPRSLAVTPYVVDGAATVTSMLALLAKAKMLRKRPASALLAGGAHVAAEVSLTVHRDPAWFDTNIRSRELEKYPPARALLSIPFHRRLLWWYVGRVAITFERPVCTLPGGADRVTITSVVDGRLRITPLAPDLDVTRSEVDVGPAVPDGPACLLVHDETDGMAELLQFRLLGDVRGGRFTVRSRTGSLDPQRPGPIAQLKSLWHLNRSARANRPTLDAWDDRPSR